ncbi:hypothetical protein AB1Y20_014736 [Prymnesium parvum]|uniref:B30.2/SPRY domain-containing protein n=1 Tax=Prymnesium parvum TaxID=97485 RepID=A0AB34ICY5_PRYPA
MPPLVSSAWAFGAQGLSCTAVCGPAFSCNLNGMKQLVHSASAMNASGVSQAIGLPGNCKSNLNATALLSMLPFVYGKDVSTHDNDCYTHSTTPFYLDQMACEASEPHTRRICLCDIPSQSSQVSPLPFLAGKEAKGPMVTNARSRALSSPPLATTWVLGQLGQSCNTVCGPQSSCVLPEMHSTVVSARSMSALQFTNALGFSMTFTSNDWQIGANNGYGSSLLLENSATIRRGTYIRSSASFTAPISVTASFKAHANECFTMSLFHDEQCGGSHCSAKNAGLSWENGGWGNKLRFSPGDWIQTVGYPTGWHTGTLDVASDGTASFYYNGVLMYQTAYPTTASGPLQFIGGCTGFDVKDVIISINT